jgi:hypothetical protein
MKKFIFGCFVIAACVLLALPRTHAQGSLQFSRVLLVDNNIQSVPANTVWKVESVMSVSTLVPSTGTSDNSYYTISKTIEVNGSLIIVSRASRYTENNSRYNSEATTDIGIDHVTELPLWLPAGTTLRTGSNAIYVSVIEFNIVP